MQVRKAWSGEVNPGSWRKVDVFTDETDLRRILVEAGLGHVDPVNVPVRVAFVLLAAEAERLLVYMLMSEAGHPSPEVGNAKLVELSTLMDSALTELREPSRE